MDCILCGSVETRPYWNERLVQCVNCSLVRAADRYFTYQPSAIYTDEYFQGAEYMDYMRERKALMRNFQRRIRTICELAPDANRLVEIGCGYGFFLELAGRYWSVKGFEISEYAVQQAQKLGQPCIWSNYLFEDMRDHVPDIVCLWDTIEHLATPRRMLEKVASDLRSQGLIAISTGDIGACLPQLQKSSWRLIHPPTHLWYFSSVTLVQLLREVGFEPVRIVYPFYYRSLFALLGKLSRYIPRWVGDLPIPLQTGDIMEVYMRKLA